MHPIAMIPGRIIRLGLNVDRLIENTEIIGNNANKNGWNGVRLITFFKILHSKKISKYY
jgi:hypothetical protein